MGTQELEARVKLFTRHVPHPPTFDRVSVAEGVLGTPIDAQNVVNRHYKPLLKQAGSRLSASTTSGIVA